jgi:gas vesicle protein
MSDFYKILVVGQSGKGKTYGARTLNPAETGFVNVEDKPLPFKNHFINHTRTTTVKEAKEAITKYAKDPTIKVIVIDSLSSYLETLLRECRGSVKLKGFEVWNTYNEEIGNLMSYIKSIQKEIIITAHYEISDNEGDSEKYVKVKGKEWKNLIEKEFTIVLYADRNKDDSGNVRAWLDLSLDSSSSKCPPDIFSDPAKGIVNRIENDYQFMIDKVAAFAGR